MLASARSARRRSAIAGAGASGCARLHLSSFVRNASEHRTAKIDVPRFMPNPPLLPGVRSACQRSRHTLLGAAGSRLQRLTLRAVACFVGRAAQRVEFCRGHVSAVAIQRSAPDRRSVRRKSRRRVPTTRGKYEAMPGGKSIRPWGTKRNFLGLALFHLRQQHRPFVMKTATEYLQFARDCKRLADECKSEADREALLQMAKEWTEIGTQISAPPSDGDVPGEVNGVGPGSTTPP